MREAGPMHAYIVHGIWLLMGCSKKKPNGYYIFGCNSLSDKDTTLCYAKVCQDELDTMLNEV